MAALVDAPLLPAWAVESLRCPVIGGRLRRVDGRRFVAEEGDHCYPDAAGRPRLMAGEAQYLAVDQTRSTGSSRTGQLGIRIDALLRPSASLNLVSARNYELMRELLERDYSPQARVLVIGGGNLGIGVEALLESDVIDAAETDVYPAPRVQLLCDAHHLPFADCSFDAVVAQAFLEHVLDPLRVVGEIHRVLRPDGVVYSEIPFMQQVHEGPFDFTRYTELGHRRLFRMFAELGRGPVGDPGMALAWSLRYFARSIPAKPGRVLALLDRVVTLLTFLVKYLDRLLLAHPGARDGASGTYFMGRKREGPMEDADLLASYSGTIPAPSR